MSGAPLGATRCTVIAVGRPVLGFHTLWVGFILYEFLRERRELFNSDTKGDTWILVPVELNCERRDAICLKHTPARLRHAYEALDSQSPGARPAVRCILNHILVTVMDPRRHHDLHPNAAKGLASTCARS